MGSVQHSYGRDSPCSWFAQQTFVAASGSSYRVKREKVMTCETFVLEMLDKPRDAVKLHPLALMMEVKVRIVHKRVIQKLYSTFVCFLYRLFISLLVHKVHKIVLAINRHLLRHV